VSLVTFTVNDSGYVSYPITGDIYVQNLNVDEIAIQLQEILKSYFNQPSVTVKKVNKMITVLGEVRLPGQYTYTQQSLNIFEALGKAGDITIHGNKENVLLLREEKGTIKRWQLDMTSENLMSSPQYYLNSGDVLIVRSRKSALWSITASTISLTLAFLTTLVVVLSYFQP
jgi:polysaccharide export outer membrane protein